MSELISIIVPVFNAEKYLALCVESILKQSYKNIELILVNDGSVDESLSICKRYQRQDHRIKVIDKANGGVSSARNAGLAIAQGDFIGFVDSDDRIDTEMYEALLELIKLDGSQCAVLTNYVIQKQKKEFQNARVVNRDEALNLLLDLKFPTSLWAYLYKAEVIGNARLNEQFQFFEDFEFNYRVIGNSQTISLCPYSLYYYNVNEGSINSQGIHPKRLTCLPVADCVRKDLNNNNRRVADSYFFESHFLISVLAPIRFPLKKADMLYLNAVRSYLSANWSRLVLAQSTPLKYKVAITLAAVNLKVLALAHSAAKKVLR